MRKLAVGLLAAAGIALALPAHAQGVWFGAGPVGVGFGTGPYSYGYGPYWGGSYAYAPGYAYGYGYAPGYTYAPGYAYNSAPAYDVNYAYGPDYDWYGADLAYTPMYAAPAYRYSSYAYEPQPNYTRRIVRTHAPHYVATRHLGYHSARISAEAYRAQASVPVRQVVRRSHRVRMDRDNTSVPGQGVLKDDVTPLR